MTYKNNLTNANRDNGTTRTLERERIANLKIGYQEWIMDLVEHGFDIFFITMHFRKMPGDRSAQIQIMQQEAQRVFGTLMPFINRRPSTAKIARLPIMWSLPDYPVPKRDRQSIRIVAKNDGLHLHSILGVPPRCRLRRPIDRHFEVESNRYLKPDRYLSTITATPVDQTVNKVVAYFLKAIERGRVSPDDMLILPVRTEDLAGGRSGAKAPGSGAAERTSFDDAEIVKRHDGSLEDLKDIVARSKVRGSWIDAPNGVKRFSSAQGPNMHWASTKGTLWFDGKLNEKRAFARLISKCYGEHQKARGDAVE